MTGARAERPRIVYLDVIRGLAVLAVLGVHLAAPVTHPIFAGGYVGVDVFNVLSGYLITRILLRRRLAYATFLGHRCRRLLPAFLALLAIGVPLALLAGTVAHSVPVESAALAVTMTAPFYLAHHGPGLAPFSVCWSLAIEWYFYLLWPLVLNRVPRHLLPRVALGGCLVLYLGAAAFLPPWWFYFSPPMRFAQLLIGCWLATRPAFVVADTAHSLRLVRAAVVAAAAALLGWVCFGPLENGTAYRWMGVPLVMVAAAVLVRLGAVFEPVLHRLAVTRLLAGLGYIGYSVYLWHDFFVGALPPHLVLGSRVATYAVACLLPAPVVLLSFRFLERPFLGTRPARAPSGAAPVTPSDARSSTIVSGDGSRT